jgi:hypothetical protein
MLLRYRSSNAAHLAGSAMVARTMKKDFDMVTVRIYPPNVPTAAISEGLASVVR